MEIWGKMYFSVAPGFLRFSLLLLSLLVGLNNGGGIDHPHADREKVIADYLGKIEPIVNEKCQKSSLSEFNYKIHLTKENEQINTKNIMAQSALAKEIQAEIISLFPWWRELKSPQLRKQMRSYFLAGPGNASQATIEKAIKMTSDMMASYATATVCDYKNASNCNLNLDSDLIPTLKKTRDFEEAKHYWTAWHDAMNKAVSPKTYSEYVKIANELSIASDFPNNAEAIADSYNTEDGRFSFSSFEKEIDELWASLKPSYMKLHAYVRMKLRRYYGPEKINDPQGHLPAHILGNMWAQEWENIESITKPFPEVPSVDATEALNKKGYTPLKIFQEADKFFTDLGLQPMNKAFWEHSVIEKPKDREILCHATAFDLCIPTNSTGQTGDYRIKMCTQVTQYHFGIVHHEMGHTQYQMHYSHQPYTFRAGANPGFHEAVGDALGHAVTTPKHMQCFLGLDMGIDVDCKPTNKAQRGKISKADLNLLFFKAVGKIPVMPFAISMESWKWGVLTGKIKLEDYNKRWWEIRKENQGIIPPTQRPNNGMDPAAKYHIVQDIEYIRYFVSKILEFQFFEAMCIHAGEFNPKDPNTKPLYQCDFSGSKAAGAKLAKMMSAGSSRPWPDILEDFCGIRNLSVKSILNYFKPIFDWLDDELKANAEKPCFGSCYSN